MTERAAAGLPRGAARPNSGCIRSLVETTVGSPWTTVSPSICCSIPFGPGMHSSSWSIDVVSRLLLVAEWTDAAGGVAVRKWEI